MGVVLGQQRLSQPQQYRGLDLAECRGPPPEKVLKPSLDDPLVVSEQIEILSPPDPDRSTRWLRPNQASPRNAARQDPDTVPVGHELGPEILLSLPANTAGDERGGIVQDDLQDGVRARNVRRRILVVQTQQSAGLEV